MRDGERILGPAARLAGRAILRRAAAVRVVEKYGGGRPPPLGPRRAHARNATDHLLLSIVEFRTGDAA